MATRSVSIRGEQVPVFLPSIRDPRLHVAVVLLSVQVLGQVGLGFHLTVFQILAAILTCAVIEVALTYRSSKALVWPASAMLTGNGVALILRAVGQPAHDPWGTQFLLLFAGVAAFGLATKYLIRFRGTHVFNPSNVALVVAFLVLGSDRVQPLDFWWGPLDGWVLAAYAVILTGGILITRRLRLLTMAAAFWLTLAVGLGILAASGHCMTADWAFGGVCGTDFWRVIVTSPEVLIFLFFMITDPKTIPSGHVARIAFAVSVGAPRVAAHRAPDQRVVDQGDAADRARGDVRGPPGVRAGDAPGGQRGGPDGALPGGPAAARPAIHRPAPAGRHAGHRGGARGHRGRRHRARRRSCPAPATRRRHGPAG
ncbi:MAG: hypothetical protein U0667_09200 [Chloroflexota bacterium]